MWSLNPVDYLSNRFIRPNHIRTYRATVTAKMGNTAAFPKGSNAEGMQWLKIAYKGRTQAVAQDRRVLGDCRRNCAERSAALNDLSKGQPLQLVNSI